MVTFKEVDMWNNPMKQLVVLSLLWLTAASHGASLPPLNQAVVDNDQSKIDRLLTSGLSQDEKDNALGAAAGKNNLLAARKLLSAGASPNRDFLEGRTSVVIAAVEGNAEVLEVLLKAGGNPNSSDAFGWRPLHHTTYDGKECVKCIEVLIRNGAEVDAVTSLDITPLHRAAGFGHASAVKTLLASGASKTLKDKYGNSAYQRAMNSGHEEVARLLR